MMPPPKSKLLKKQATPKIIETQQTRETQNNEFDSQRFEVELYWCIQQMQSALNSGKLSEKQGKDHRKALNTLMSHSAPVIKKRQVMRLSFGDYRAKMAEEDKKITKAISKIKVSPAKPSSKSVFLKKHLFQTSEPFQFNFKKSEVDDINKDIEKVSIKDAKCDFKFTPSDNAFRFNFDVT